MKEMAQRDYTTVQRLADRPVIRIEQTDAHGMLSTIDIPIDSMRHFLDALQVEAGIYSGGEDAN